MIPSLRFVPAIVVLSLLVFAPRADAFCGTDGWASTTAGLAPLGVGTVVIALEANMNHGASHPTCFGDLRAKAILAAGGPTCVSGWASEQHIPGEGNEFVSAATTCSVNCGQNIRASGEANWNGETDNRFPESGNIQQPCDCAPPPGGCTIEGCIWSYYYCECVDCCPLVFDTSGKGYKLTSGDLGVWFDINADGQQDAISWTDPSRDVAFLAFDRNGNMAIDHGEELFGNATPLPGSTPAQARHGFDALASLESTEYGASTRDGIIDGKDAAYHKLLLWKDGNHDGMSQRSELTSAAQAGLVGIETRYRNSRRTDEFGNEYRLRGISWWKRAGRLDARFFYDVWFVPRS